MELKTANVNLPPKFFAAPDVVCFFTPLGDLFGFIAPPIKFFAFLAGFVVAYLALVEILKRVFYKRYAHRLEQYA